MHLTRISNKKKFNNEKSNKNAGKQVLNCFYISSDLTEFHGHFVIAILIMQLMNSLDTPMYENVNWVVVLRI